MLFLGKETVRKLYELAFYWHTEPSDAVRLLIETAHKMAAETDDLDRISGELERIVRKALQREVGDEDE